MELSMDADDAYWRLSAFIGGFNSICISLGVLGVLGG
jgi:hypothetical protein